MLAHLAGAATARSVVDPMAGTGDMLAAVRASGGGQAQLMGIEIDPRVVSICMDRFQDTAGTNVHRGDAFVEATWSLRMADGWDLVITNPPYVRYQRGKYTSIGELTIPSADDVRHTLADFVTRSHHLTAEERRVFRRLSDSYSGLADLAVPSWILCASLVGVGGKLAMVVPDTWLSRDYALPVLYLLRRFFDIEVLVKDVEAAWFKDALVRTNLIVARRVLDRGTAFKVSPGYPCVKLKASALNETSMVGACFPDSDSPDQDLSNMVLNWRNDQGIYEGEDFSISWVSGETTLGMLANGKNADWIRGCEPPDSIYEVHQSSSSLHIPPVIQSTRTRTIKPWSSLSDYGWSVGQGLRTGANRFFYGDRLKDNTIVTLLTVDPAIGSGPIEVPSSMLRPCIRRQSDLGSSAVAPFDPKGRVVSLQQYALGEDIDETEAALGFNPFQQIPEPFASHIRCAALTNVDRIGQSHVIPSLSAVATNVRPLTKARPGYPPRFWYQLPPFKQRHYSVLFIPRINHGHPRVFINTQALIVDANFSTLWPYGKNNLSVWAMLALLNSSWVALMLEDAATVLGGGALKVEASHLRRVPLPMLSTSDKDSLTYLGRELAKPVKVSRDIESAIDQIVLARVCSSDYLSGRRHDHILRLKEQLLQERGAV